MVSISNTSNSDHEMAMSTFHAVAIHPFVGDALTSELSLEAGDAVAVSKIAGAWAHGRRLSSKAKQSRGGAGWFPLSHVRPIHQAARPARIGAGTRCRTAPGAFSGDCSGSQQKEEEKPAKTVAPGMTGLVRGPKYKAAWIVVTTVAE